MSPEQIIALCGGIVSIIAAIGAVLAARAAAQTQAIVKADAQKKDGALKEIHELVNSRLTEALDEIIQLRKFIVKLTGKPSEDAVEEKSK